MRYPKLERRGLKKLTSFGDEWTRTTNERRFSVTTMQIFWESRLAGGRFWLRASKILSSGFFLVTLGLGVKYGCREVEEKFGH